MSVISTTLYGVPVPDPSVRAALFEAGFIIGDEDPRPVRVEFLLRSMIDDDHARRIHEDAIVELTRTGAICESVPVKATFVRDRPPMTGKVARGAVEKR